LGPRRPDQTERVRRCLSARYHVRYPCFASAGSPFLGIVFSIAPVDFVFVTAVVRFSPRKLLDGQFGPNPFCRCGTNVEKYQTDDVRGPHVPYRFCSVIARARLIAASLVIQQPSMVSRRDKEALATSFKDFPPPPPPSFYRFICTPRVSRALALSRP